MQPRPARAIASPNTWLGSSVPWRLSAITGSMPSTGRSKKDCPGARVAAGILPPAALTSTSSRPHCSSTASRAASSCARSSTSAGRARAVPPSAVDRLDHCLGLLAAAAQHADLRAGARQPARHPAAQHARAAGDDRHLPGQAEQLRQSAGVGSGVVRSRCASTGPRLLCLHACHLRTLPLHWASRRRRDRRVSPGHRRSRAPFRPPHPRPAALAPPARPASRS